MEQNSISVGLDIGTTKIVAMVGKENEFGMKNLLKLISDTRQKMNLRHKTKEDPTTA